MQEQGPSWKFLEKISTVVANEFSSEDREALMQIGKILNQNGATYVHQKNQYDLSQNIERDNKKSKDLSL